MAKKILLIDDEIELLRLLELFLTKKGFQVITADSGEEGLEIIDRDKAIDLIVLDHRMPGLDGSEVLKELEIRKNKTPVILLTGSLGKDTERLEVDEFLMKPVDLEEIREKINELISE